MGYDEHEGHDPKREDEADAKAEKPAKKADEPKPEAPKKDTGEGKH